MPDGTTITNRTFRQYRVVARKAESDLIASFTLEPADGGPLPAVLAGQHLVFRLANSGDTLLRHYSVSGDTGDARHLRIAVKREPAPAGSDLPPGRGSAYFHDGVQPGDILTAAGPVGDFVLREDSDRPVVLLSGGVGITPVLCMLHRLVAHSKRRVVFVHACENGSVHAFRDEVLALAQSRPGVTVHFCYRNPTPDDTAAGRFHAQGLIDRGQLQSLLPLDDYDFYLCGPTPFMQSNWRLLRSLGVDAGRIHYEFFGPATVLDTEDAVPVTVQASGAAADIAPPAGGSDDAAVSNIAPTAFFKTSPGGSTVAASEPGTAAGGMATASPALRFLPSGIEVDDADDGSSLLELAERAGLQPDFNCRAGLCNTCMATLVSGEVEYFETPLEDPPPGKVLICCSRPVGEVVVELSS